MNTIKSAALGFVFFAGVGVYALPALGQQSAAAKDEASFAALLKCRTMAEPVQKASCYDAAMDNIQRFAHGGKVNIVTEVQIENLERDAFGFTLPSLSRLRLERKGPMATKSVLNNTKDAPGGKVLKKNKSGEVIRVAYEVSHVVTRLNGRKRVYLKNGQTWEEIGSDTLRFSGKKPYTVEIKRASLGSYLMIAKGSKRTARVRRVE